MSRTAFEGVLETARGGGAVVYLPPEVVEALGGMRVRVSGTLNGVEFASNTMPAGHGEACLGVHKATREAAGVEFGEVVQVELEVDERPREVELPPELTEALAGEPELRAVFDKLSFTHRLEYAKWIGDAKRPETRMRRVNEALERLRARR
jgi:hypothetical protein